MSDAPVTSSVEPSSGARPTPRRRWITAAIAAAPFAAMACVYAVACWRGLAPLRHEVQEIQQRGEALRFVDLAPRPHNPESLRKQGLLHRQRLASARLALAVVRHRMTHGTLPKSLDELDKPPIEQPIGLLSGKPLVYETTGEGFSIYDELPEQGRFEIEFSNHGNEQ